jgi:hypothetical protein
MGKLRQVLLDFVETETEILADLEEEGGKRHEVRVFGTMTRDLMALADWLAAQEGSEGGSTQVRF